MSYQSLSKVYYNQPQKHQEVYLQRFNAPFTKHLNIDIQQFNHPKAYPAFFCYTEEMFQLAENIRKENAKLYATLSKMPDIAATQFINSIMVQEIISTNDIEGIHSTRREITTALKKQYDAKGITRYWSVVNKYNKIINNETIDFSSVQALRKFYDEFILDEVINLDPNNTPDGKIFRKDSVSIGEYKDIHRGTYPENKIIEYMEKSLAILNDDNIPSLISLSIFHYLFGYIHPFYDGNGRTSRFISSYYLSKQIHPIVALSLSVSIKANKKKYYALFEETNSELNRGDLSLFIIEFLSLILSSITNVQMVLESKIAKLNKYTQILDSKLDELGITNEVTIAIYHILLQSVLFSSYGSTVSDIGEKIKKSRNTVDNYIKQIPLEHIIKETDTRPYRYRLNSMILK